MLTFELAPNSDEVHLHGDAKSLRALADYLCAVALKAEHGTPEHVHLMSPDWGGNDLSIIAQALEPGWRCMHHVKIFGWPEK